LEWPGERALNSAEYQALAAWQEMLGQVPALEAVHPSLTYPRALAWVRRLASTTLFQPQTREVPIQVLGMLEAGGITF
jgi:hypothetical protein